MASLKQLDERRYKITVSNGYRPDGRKVCKARTLHVPKKIPRRSVLQYVMHAAEELEKEFKYGYAECALPGFVDSKNEEKTERNAGYLVVSHSGGGMLRQGTRKGIRRTPANRGMRAHWVVKGLDISEDVCHGMCP